MLDVMGTRPNLVIKVVCIQCIPSHSSKLPEGQSAGSITGKAFGVDRGGLCVHTLYICIVCIVCKEKEKKKKKEKKGKNPTG